jgi:hypothetical protein
LEKYLRVKDVGYPTKCLRAKDVGYSTKCLRVKDDLSVHEGNDCCLPANDHYLQLQLALETEWQWW